MNVSTAGEEASALLDGLPWPPTKADVMRALVQSNNAGFSRCLRKQIAEQEAHNREMQALDATMIEREIDPKLQERIERHTQTVVDMVAGLFEGKR